MSTVDTPDCTTIAAVGELLSLPESRCVKTMLVRGEDGPIAIVLRGGVYRVRRRKATGIEEGAGPEGACAFLDGEGGCRVYPDRPYVCRTQGLPLRWIAILYGRIEADLALTTGIHTAEDVLKLRGNLTIEYTFAKIGAKRLWYLINHEDYVPALGALTGNQAVQQVEAGLKAIYLSGWQVAADANLAGEMYPDQSLYPANSVPAVVQRINKALRRADQVQVLDGRKNGPYWFAPIVADAEAGFGGPLNAFELMKQMIEAGAAGVHFEDQLSSAKKCGHMGGKVLVPTQEANQKLTAARLASDVMGVPTVLLARTDAEAATLLTSDIDPNDQPFISHSFLTSS